jgi:hypothetical protein
MVSKIYKNSITCIAVIIFAFIFVGSAFAGNSNLANAAKDTEGAYAEIKGRLKDHSGPPAHAPAHGYRAKYQYHYYPSCKVYYDTAREIYFYLKGENWEVGVTLPSHIKNDLGEYVSLELETDKPYLLNEEHNKKYSSKQLKSKSRQKNVFTKLWFLLFAR